MLTSLGQWAMKTTKYLAGPTPTPLGIAPPSASQDTATNWGTHARLITCQLSLQMPPLIIESNAARSHKYLDRSEASKVMHGL